MIPFKRVKWMKNAEDTIREFFSVFYTRWEPIGRSGALMQVEGMPEPHVSCLTKKQILHRKIRNRMAKISRRRNRNG